tara:strand:- start:827 stop:1396 length:570 start_codon:yes stop_codon:yes gene_type:complete
MENNCKQISYLGKNETDIGFGLVDAILSLSLLAGIIVYGVYFSSLRLSTVYSSNLIRSINKEIERDIERLKLDLWSLNYDRNNKKYLVNETECLDFSESIISLPSWITETNSASEFIQSWRPGPERSKIFSGNKVLITRELKMSSPIENQSLNNSIATLNYRVEWGGNNKHWLSIDLSPESHSWCEQFI